MRKELLVWLLRLAGTVETLAFIAVVMPRSWMEFSHEWLGMGTMPAVPVLDFMIRQASFVYGAHGLSLWVLSFDLERFRPLIVLNGIAYLVGAPVFFLIDYSSGMPRWWAWSDAVGCALIGAAFLWLSRRKQSEATGLWRT